MIRHLCGLALLALLLLASCNDAPSDVGSVVLVDTLNARTVSSKDTTIIVSSSAQFVRSWAFNDGIGRLFVGQTPSMRAASMCRLTLIDTLGWLTEDLIDSATVLIRPRRYSIGSGTSDSTLGFLVVDMAKSFMQASTSPNVTWTDLFSSGITPNASYFPTTDKPLASFKGSVRHDTLMDMKLSVTADGKKTLANWFQRAAKKDSSYIGFGILPTLDSKVIQEFSAANLVDTFPNVRITMYYHTSSNEHASLTIEGGNNVTFVDADTLQSPLMLVQPVVQSYARFACDVSFVPKTDAILKAEFRFSIDTSKTLVGSVNTGDTLYVAAKYDSGGVAKNIYSFKATRTANSCEYVVNNVGLAIDLARKYSSKPMYLDISAFGQHLERCAVYDLSAPEDKRPKLVVTYAERPTIGARK